MVYPTIIHPLDRVLFQRQMMFFDLQNAHIITMTKKNRKQKPIKPTGQGKDSRSSNTLRIIGGQWRSRKLSFPNIEGLRPTTDRVRETLFNWIQSDVGGAQCLDLFCGSGALGLEALSREAKAITFVDREPAVTSLLQSHFSLLGANGASAITANATDWLTNNANSERQFDLVFLDPPFRQGLLAPVVTLLIEGNYLKPDAKIYIEIEAEDEEFDAPDGWSELKTKKAGQVRYSLYQAP